MWARAKEETKGNSEESEAGPEDGAQQAEGDGVDEQAE